MKAEIVMTRAGLEYRLDGVVVSEQEFNRAVPGKELGAPMTTHAYDSSSPLVGAAAGCHPSQVASMNEYLHKRGVVGANFRPDGKVEFRTRRARRDFCKARGLVDFDGGFGDA